MKAEPADITRNDFCERIKGQLIDQLSIYRGKTE